MIQFAAMAGQERRPDQSSVDRQRAERMLTIQEEVVRDGYSRQYALPTGTLLVPEGLTSIPVGDDLSQQYLGVPMILHIVYDPEKIEGVDTFDTTQDRSGKPPSLDPEGDIRRKWRTEGYTYDEGFGTERWMVAIKFKPQDTNNS